VARGSSEGVSIVGGSVSRFGALFWTLFWLVIGLRSTLEHRSPGSFRGHYGVIMDKGRGKRQVRVSKPSVGHPPGG